MKNDEKKNFKKGTSTSNASMIIWYGNPQFCSDWSEIEPIRKD